MHGTCGWASRDMGEERLEFDSPPFSCLGALLVRLEACIAGWRAGGLGRVSVMAYETCFFPCKVSLLRIMRARCA